MGLRVRLEMEDRFGSQQKMNLGKTIKHSGHVHEEKGLRSPCHREECKKYQVERQKKSGSPSFEAEGKRT